MAVLNWGEALDSPYLQILKPAVGVTMRIAFLDVERIVAQQFHYLDDAFGDFKGSYQCSGGVCCSVCGLPQQRYYLPIWVYNNPQVSAEGSVKALRITKSQYDTFLQLKAGVDFYNTDFLVITKQKGRSSQTDFFPCQDASILDPGVRQELYNSLETFYRFAEESLAKPMNEETWTNIFVQCGVDVTGADVPRISTLKNFNQAPQQNQIPQQVSQPKPVTKPNIGGFQPKSTAKPSFKPMGSVSQASNPAPTQGFRPAPRTVPVSQETNTISDPVNAAELNAMLDS